MNKRIYPALLMLVGIGCFVSSGCRSGTSKSSLCNSDMNPYYSEDSTNVMSGSVLIGEQVRIDSILMTGKHWNNDVVWAWSAGTDSIALWVLRSKDCEGVQFRSGQTVRLNLYEPSFIAIGKDFGTRTGGQAFSMRRDGDVVVPSGYRVYKSPCLCSDKTAVWYTE